MQPANKQLLDQCRPFHRMLVISDSMQGMSHFQMTELERVMREEFYPGYSANLTCPPCIGDFIRLVYNAYDKWISEQPKELPQVVQEEPLIVATGFPANEGTTISERAKKRLEKSVNRHRR